MSDYDVERDSQDLSDAQSIWDSQSDSDSQGINDSQDLSYPQDMSDPHDYSDSQVKSDSQSINASQSVSASKNVKNAKRVKNTRGNRYTRVMTDTEVKKRAWVKNVAIIFLAVMLFLTFFSQTIMNRSLPEVAAQYTTSGSITARIRGSGQVVANETFEVKITGLPRTVSEVPVRLGDNVEIGDMLIRFTGTGTENLDAAEADLRRLERELEELQLELSLSDGRVAAANRAVQAARNYRDDAQRRLNEINFNQAAYNSAQTENTRAQNALTTAQAAATAREYELNVAQAELDALEAAEDAIPGSVDIIALEAARKKAIDAQKAYSLANATLSSAIGVANAAATAFAAQSANRDAFQSATTSLRDAQLSLDNANAELTAAQQSANVNNSLDAIRLREKRREIDDQRAVIAELRETAGSTSITSLVGGIVTSVDIQPGNQAVSDAVLMVIEVVDRGYSISFTVTVAQASRVNIGDQADVDRGWYWRPGEEIRATLINIRNSPQNPMAERILRFNITGDVRSGDQLNLVLAQRSENYNIIVPNSAIRTDTNGDFVLVVVPRTSPLGNRYIATRADVNILARDDTHTAVTGALTGWDFVITTSSAPINPGMQVRLADN